MPPPRAGEVTIQVRAAGVNPADHQHFAVGQDPGRLPLRIGYEVAGVITALGPGTELASGDGQAGDGEPAKKFVAGFYDRAGFDTVDIGGLDQSWRTGMGQPAFVTRQNAAQLRANVARAHR